MYLGCDSKLENPRGNLHGHEKKMLNSQPELKIEQRIVKLGDLVKLFCHSGLLSACSLNI